MKRLLLTIPLLMSTMAIGPCGPINIGTVDGGGDGPHPDGGPDRVDAPPDQGAVPDAPSGGGGAGGTATGGAQTGGMAGGGVGTAGGEGYLNPSPTGNVFLGGMSTNDTFEWHGATTAP